MVVVVASENTLELCEMKRECVELLVTLLLPLFVDVDCY
jgi:hypothetical protein